MNTWELGQTFAKCIAEEVTSNLGIDTNWVGDPATSTFGIMINLTWNGNLIRSCLIDFIGKTID